MFMNQGAEQKHQHGKKMVKKMGGGGDREGRKNLLPQSAPRRLVVERRRKWSQA